MRRLKAAALAAVAIVVGLAVSPALRETLLPWRYAPSLARVKTWEYQLQSYQYVEPGRTKADLLVVDYSRANPAGGPMIPFTPEEVQRLKRKPAGGKRLVLAYLSIGEAEEYRYYWKPEWRSSKPSWLVGENCRWPRNHVVRYWETGWKDIVFRAPDSYLARIVAAGFDGVYLDRIDAYADLTRLRHTAQDDMTRFVVELAAEARRQRNGFLVVAQNAEALLSDSGYRAAIDGIAKEDLLYGVAGTGKRNGKDLIDWSLGQIKLLQRDGKAALVAEYLRSAEQIASARAELKSLRLGYVFPPRALDGSDPLIPPPIGQTEADQTGTPEYGQRNCEAVPAHKGRAEASAGAIEQR